MVVTERYVICSQFKNRTMHRETLKFSQIPTCTWTENKSTAYLLYSLENNSERKSNAKKNCYCCCCCFAALCVWMDKIKQCVKWNWWWFRFLSLRATQYASSVIHTTNVLLSIRMYTCLSCCLMRISHVRTHAHTPTQLWQMCISHKFSFSVLWTGPMLSVGVAHVVYRKNSKCTAIARKTQVLPSVFIFSTDFRIKTIWIWSFFSANFIFNNWNRNKLGKNPICSTYYILKQIFRINVLP